MSRKDKRSGRVSYKRSDRWEINFIKALLGRDYLHQLAPTIIKLALLDREAPNIEDLKILKAEQTALLGTLKDYATGSIDIGDGNALVRLGRMMRRIDIKKAADPEAVEILIAYAQTRISDFKKPRLDSKAPPSGKEVARVIDEVRNTFGKPALEKTHDAIRERALRLGLKLKGKRKKKK
jgi:hypothetical protein